MRGPFAALSIRIEQEFCPVDFCESLRTVYEHAAIILSSTAPATLMFAVVLPLHAQTHSFSHLQFNTNIAPPAYPTEPAQCNRFYADAHKIYDEIHAVHDQCLKKHSGDTEQLRGNTGSCSMRACQSLHTERDKIQKRMHDGKRQCMDALAERRRSPSDSRRASGPERAAQKFDSAEFKAALMRGPASAVRRVVRDNLSIALAQVFGSTSAAVKNGLNVGIATGMIVQNFQEIREACRAQSGETSKECDAEILSTTRNLVSSVPSWVRTDPAVILIQRGVFARLNVELEPIRQAIETLPDRSECAILDSPRRTELVINQPEKFEALTLRCK